MAVFEVLGTTIDVRTNTNIVYVKSGVVDYINLVGDDFDDFEMALLHKSAIGQGIPNPK